MYKNMTLNLVAGDGGGGGGGVVEVAAVTVLVETIIRITGVAKWWWRVSRRNSVGVMIIKWRIYETKVFFYYFFLLPACFQFSFDVYTLRQDPVVTGHY